MDGIASAFSRRVMPADRTPLEGEVEQVVDGGNL